ncbi:MAG: hypothetical protein ACW981_00010 [Candidatus Hodarchaeales archaeon]|jgi:hypothetical protein
MDVLLLEKAITKAKPRIVRYFDILGGKETRDSISLGTKGIRRVGSERFLQAEFYFWFKKSFSDHITSLELKPFDELDEMTDNSEISSDDSIDLAIFNSFDSLKQLPPIAEVWIELKSTGGQGNIKEIFTENFNKLYELADLFIKQEVRLPSIILIMIFLENKNELFSPELRLINFLEPEQMQNVQPWFKERFYECILWREEREWKIKKSFEYLS